ncbi:AraC family transcriptional regulator [Maricaulis sp.]|uniref:helix-turn-helix domain-containing protein n=1 Tax=Maricaulis sp. TaxID=1486257 RepID=UPI002614441B|nr:AraC family transcriptional regulator [Maricaulis sp.]
MNELVLGWRTLLLLLVSVHLLIAAGFLLRRRHERRANTYLVLLLVVAVGHFTPQMIGFAGFYDRWPGISYTPFALDWFLGPLVWAYAWALTREDAPPPGRWLWLPGFVELGYGLVMMVQSAATKDWWSDHVHRPYIANIEDTGGLIVLIIALIVSWQHYQRYRGWLKHHSSAASEFDPRWLGVFLVAMGLLISAIFINEAAHLIFGPLSYIQQYPVYIAAGAVFYILALGALLQQREAFPKMPLETADNPQESSEPQGRDWATEAASLRQRIVTENWHLEPRLSAPDLARRLATNETYLSRTVNLGAGQNFNRFINTIRVEAVKAELAGGAEDVLHAALACGFNSKATFNRVFRDVTGMTPAAYRAQHMSASVAGE